MEYNLIIEESISDFINEVNRMIQEGWTPLGSASSHCDGYLQAVTRSTQQVGAQALMEQAYRNTEGMGGNTTVGGESELRGGTTDGTKTS